MFRQPGGSRSRRKATSPLRNTRPSKCDVEQASVEAARRPLAMSTQAREIEPPIGRIALNARTVVPAGPPLKSDRDLDSRFELFSGAASLPALDRCFSHYATK